jgi:hypothetical protein
MLLQTLRANAPLHVAPPLLLRAHFFASIRNRRTEAINVVRFRQLK